MHFPRQIEGFMAMILGFTVVMGAPHVGTWAGLGLAALLTLSARVRGGVLAPEAGRACEPA
ncbi:MAG: hypothetical protein HY721_15315 [Planctomycetes bacterium]|nr:hypothetical protein [Planctomycetota bacterium]